MANSNDPFDDVLNLEDTFYSEGYAQGVADGDRAGRIEGRSFGIEKGFEKFVEAGRLHAKSIVWANRLQSQLQDQKSTVPPTFEAKRLPSLTRGGAKLEKNIITLHALVEPDTLSTENSDEAVNDFDDRVKRAQGKATVIERQIGEDVSSRVTNKAESSLATEVKSGGGSSAANPPPKEALSF